MTPKCPRVDDDALGDEDFEQHAVQGHGTVVSGAVDQQQHHEDQDDRDDRDVVQARVRDRQRVRGHRCRTADVDLQSRRWSVLRDDVTHGVHGLVGLDLADVARQPQQHVGRLAVDALRAGRGDRLAPQIHHVLHVLGVVLQPLHQVVVVLVVLVVERMVGFQHDHGQAGGVGLLELVADVQHRELRRRVRRNLGPASSVATSSTFGTKVFVVIANRPQKMMIGMASRRTVLAKNGRLGLMRAHADFTRQVTSASWRVADCSSRTTSSTSIRQPT